MRQLGIVFHKPHGCERLDSDRSSQLSSTLCLSQQLQSHRMRFFNRLIQSIVLIACACALTATSLSGNLDESLLPLSAADVSSTFVVLKDLNYNSLASTSLSSKGSFTFHNITEGSYLVLLESRLQTPGFYRVDVSPASEDGWLQVEAHQILNGHDVHDLGPQVGIPLNVLAYRQTFLQPRPKFSILSVLKSPMILMSIGSLVLVFVVPKLIDSMDPETLQQFQEHQAKRGTASEKVANFDMASYIAEKRSKQE